MSDLVGNPEGFLTTRLLLYMSISGPQAAQKGGWLTTSPEKNKGSTVRDRVSHASVDRSNVRSSIPTSDSIKSNHRNTERQQSHSSFRQEGPYVNLKVSPKIDKASPKYEASHDNVSPKSEVLHDSKAGFKKSVSELLTEKENRSAKKIRKRLSSEKHEQTAGSKKETENHEHGEDKAHKPDKEREPKQVNDPPSKLTETAPDKTDRDRQNSSKSKEDVITNEKEKPCDKTTENRSKHKRDGSDDSKKMIGEKSVVKNLMFEIKSRETAEKCVVDKHKQSSTNSRDSSREKKSKYVERKTVDATKLDKNNLIDNLAQKSRQGEGNHPVPKNERNEVLSKKAVISDGESNKTNSYTVSRAENKRHRNQSGEKYAAPNVTKSGPKRFADSSGGYRVRAQDQSSSVDKAVVLTSGKEQSKVLKQNSTDSKDKKSQPTLIRQISNSSSTSVESAKTNSSRTWSVSCSRSERKTSSEISTFDFAGDIFQDSVSKHEAKTSTCKLKSDKFSSVAKSVPETPAEQLKDKSHKHKQRKDDNSRNEHHKHKHKKSAVVGSDSSGTDAEFEHFKNILTQVHDSRWKTKPLESDSRRSSTQSHKSTDSSVSVSLLNPQKEIRILSKKAYKKFGVRNVEYRGKKMYYKGIKIKQPQVFIRKKDIQKVIKHRRNLKLRKKLDKAQKSKFKRIRRIGSSTPESDMRDSDKQFVSVVEESDTGLSSTGDQVKRDEVDEGKEFSWIVPDSFEESASISSDQRKKSHKHESYKKKKDSPKKKEHSEKDTHVKSKEKYHKERKKFVSPPKKKINSGVSNRNKEETDGSKWKTERSRVKSDIVSETKTEGVLGSKRKETPKMKMDSDLETNAAELIKTDICISSTSSSDESLSEAEHKRKIHFYRKERKEIPSRKTKASSSPIFKQTSHKAKSKTKSPQKRCKSSLSERGGSSVESQVENSENGMKNKTIKKDINKSAIVQETESSNSSSDTLAKNDGICDKGIVSPVVKSCEIVLTKINDRIETKVADDKDVNKKTFKETVKDPTEIPETQMSPSSTSSSDLPIFKDSPIELDNNTTVISYDKSVHDHKDNVGESEDKTEINECNNSTFSTQETQLYSCGDPVLNTRKSETQSKEKQSFDYVTNDTNQNEDGVKTEDQTDENDKVDNKSHNVLERSKNQPECTVSRSSDNGHTDEVKSNPLKKCLSPKDKIKQSFKSFQSKFMKYQQKQRKERKLKSKIITKKLKDRGLLSDKDETGEEGDIEDNLLFESSETDDSDVEILTINKNKHIQKEVSTLNLCMRENAKLDNVGKDEIQPFNIMSMSENENSDISVVGKPKEGNKTRDRSPDKSAVSDTSKDNKTLSKKSDKFVKSEPMEDKGTLNEVLPKSPLFVRNDSQNLNIQSMSENEDSDVSVLNKPREGTRTLSENSDKAVSVEPKEHINKPLTLQKKSSEPQIDKTTAQIEPESNDIVTKVDDVKIKVEEDNDKGDVRYESFTSSCSQCSSSSDVEIEKENVSILGREEIKTEKEDVNISTGKENVIVLGQEEIKTETEDVNISNIEGYRWMSTHGKELQIKQNFRNNEGSNEVETKETEENKDEKPRLSSLINNQSHSIKQEISEVEPESNTNMDHVKEEPVQIKDEPDWSKFSYTQEPDAIFVSDSEDNGNEIMSAQNETILVNSDSEDNDNTLTNQSAYDSQVLDPEFWDFSSPEIYSSSEDDVKQVRSKANDTLKASPLAGTSNVTVKHEKIETVDKSKVVKDEDLTADTDNEKITDASESVSYSCSDSSCDESEYVEIGSSDSEKEEDSTLNIVEILDDSASSVQNISSERLCNTSVTESYTTHTVKDSFDPYSVATQIAENLPSNSRAQAISEATKTKLKPHLKFLNESSSENESPFPHGSDKNSEKIKKDFAYDDLYEAYTQVDGSNCQEMRTYQEPVQVSAEDEFGQKESEDIELDNLDSFSDSSLVDAADNQIKLYEQSRKYPHKTKIVSAAGLIIKCDKNVFASNKEVHKIKKFNQGQNRDLEVPVSNETFKADNDWYSTMTQVDAPNHGKEPAASTPKENRKTAADEYAAYGASTQVDNEAFGISSENESDKNDEIDAYANMTQIDKAYSSRVSDDKVHKKNETEDDYYAALTQKDAYVFSSDSDNVEYNSANIQVVKSVTSKSMDYEKATRNAYNMETQIDYESQGTTDISLISLTDSDQSNAKKISEKDGGKIHLIQKTAKQSSSNKATVKTNVNDDSNPVAIPVSSNKDKEKDNKLNSIKEKLKLSLSKKKTIEIPMQKTNSWKMARQLSNSSSIVKSTSKRNDSSSDNASESVVKNPPIAAPKQSSNVNKPLDDIAFYNAKSSDMWLSKNTSKPMKTPTKPPGKRKRRATGEAEKGASFSSAIQEARKRLADRNYQTVLHPEMKADPQKKPKLDRPAG